MSIKERLKADPSLMKRVMRCESHDDIELLLKVEGITNPADIEEAYFMLELCDKTLEAVAGGGKSPAGAGSTLGLQTQKNSLLINEGPYSHGKSSSSAAYGQLKPDGFKPGVHERATMKNTLMPSQLPTNFF